MSIRNRFNEDLKTAMFAKDEITVSTLRLINSAIKQKDIDSRTETNKDPIKDEQILSLLQTMIKQRQESIKMYQQGNRQDLVDREEGEVKIIQKYLPAQMSDADVASAVQQVIVSIGATSVKDMGKVMAELKTKYSGQMDFGKVGAIVKEKLG